MGNSQALEKVKERYNTIKPYCYYCDNPHLVDSLKYEKYHTCDSGRTYEILAATQLYHEGALTYEEYNSVLSELNCCK